MLDKVAFKNLSHTDLKKGFSVCEQLHEVDPEASFVQHCHSVLSHAVGNIHLSVEHIQKSTFELIDRAAPTFQNCWEEVHRKHVLEHPCAQRILTRTTPDVEAVHRVPTYRQFLKTTLYNEFYDQAQSQDLIWISLQSDDQLLLYASGRDRHYSENELALLHIIQPHLQAAWKGWMRERKLRKELAKLKRSLYRSEQEERAAAGSRRQIQALPSRQREVVELVAAGNDNQQIADELGISVLTVKKHLQLIFQSLEVRHRTELAAKWYKGHSITIR